MMKLEAIISIAHMWTQFLSSFLPNPWQASNQAIEKKANKLCVCARARTRNYN